MASPRRPSTGGGAGRRLSPGAQAALDAFKPDFVLILGATTSTRISARTGCRPFASSRSMRGRVPAVCPLFPGRADQGNAWGLAPDTVVPVEGHTRRRLEPRGGADQGRFRHQLPRLPHAARARALPHAFINTVLFLDYDRRGVPLSGGAVLAVNCYGSVGHRQARLERAPDRRGRSLGGRPAGPQPVALLRHRRRDRAHPRRQPVAGGADRLVLLVARLSDREAPLDLSGRDQRPGALRRIGLGQFRPLAQSLDRADRGCRPAGIPELGHALPARWSECSAARPRSSTTSRATSSIRTSASALFRA